MARRDRWIGQGHERPNLRLGVELVENKGAGGDVSGSRMAWQERLVEVVEDPAAGGKIYLAVLRREAVDAGLG